MRTTVKTCFRCGAEKPLTDFYKHPMMADGHLGKCKNCARADVHENRVKRIEKYRAYDVERAKTAKRRALSRRIEAEYRARYPERKKANVAVNNAVRDGRLTKYPCQVCGRLDSHGHHDDYSKPLEVRWLCAVHHKQAHKELKP